MRIALGKDTDDTKEGADGTHEGGRHSALTREGAFDTHQVMLNAIHAGV
jgi:hypothetical protein